MLKISNNSLDGIVLGQKKADFDDVIWEELADDISNDWFMIASSQELSQYISIDLNKKRFGFCYDSFIETHATPDESPIIAKSYTELLEKLVSNEKEWFWLDSSF